MLEQLRLQPDESPSVDIHECMYPFEFLGTAMHWKCSLKEINDLATLLSSLDEEEQIAFEGLVKMGSDKKEGPIPVGKLVDLACSVGCCDVYPGVTNYEELGRFYVEQGLYPELKSIPEENLPFLNYEKIGEKFSKEEGGILVTGGYVLQTSDLKQVSQTLDLKPRKPEYAILMEVAQAGRSVQLPLPNSPQAMDAALDAIGARDWSGVSLECLDCAATPLIPMLGGRDSIGQLDRLARKLAEMEPADLTKYKAVLEAVDCFKLDRAELLTDALDSYLFSPRLCSPVEVAWGNLAVILPEPEEEMLTPYLDLDQYGQALIQDCGGVLTSYGLIERKDGQPVQARGPNMSPAKRVMLGEEEQESERSFRRQAETELNGLCDDERQPRQGGMEMV